MKQNDPMIDAAINVLRTAGYYTEKLWHADDVRFICEQLELPQLQRHEVETIFEIVGNLFDGETGISWPQLERAVHVFFQKKQALPPEHVPDHIYETA